ncbi:hypothetical protein HK104_001722 [Borealophlyctis nickersoniae]|nr:hypothetical protein HK104_001722 [Borealophlyctis nickersoniae]
MPCTICGKPGYQAPDGTTSDYCSNSHREEAVRRKIMDPCTWCGVRAKYEDANGYVHPYCGKTCANAASAGRANGTQAPAVRIAQRAARAAANGCLVCGKPVFVDRNGVASEYCGQRHRREAVTRQLAEGCLRCYQLPKAKRLDGTLYDFCGKKCGDETNRAAPILYRLEPATRNYQSVSDQFKNQWLHTNKTRPQIYAIYKIFLSPELVQSYEVYRQGVESRGLFTATRTARKMEPGNEQRRFHGTVLMCNLDTSATSSKSDDYSTSQNGHYKAMLLNRVVVGKAIKLTDDDETLTSPPAGHDSVIGQPGGNLNYDELIVYTDDAIRPAYLIVYETPSPVQPGQQGQQAALPAPAGTLLPW